MTNIILPTEEDKEPQYQPTETDEEVFFCIYHMNIQPSEAYDMKPDYRKWLIMRFFAQKNLEKEAYEQQRLLKSISGSSKI